MVFDPNSVPTYQSAQAELGLLPPQFTPTVYPGQISAAIAQGGYGAAAMMVTGGSPGTSFGAGMFPTQQLQTFTNQGPMLQGPTGVMMPMMPSAPYNAYPGPNPYAGLSAMGPYGGAPSMYSPRAPAPPPAYAGFGGAMPFGPPPAAPQFNTPYMAGLEQQHIAGDMAAARGWGAAGVGARVGVDAAAGFGGAQMGRRFGGNIGGIIGGVAGFLGAEMSGVGAGGQNAFMNYVASPGIHQRAMTSALMEQSQSYVMSGPGMHASGRGFDHHSAQSVAAGIREMAGSSTFQGQTGNRFNQNDLFAITQGAGREDLLTGAQSSTQMVERVRETAKSLSAFMSLAQEPDIQRALQSMGQLRASGLNLNETLTAVSHGRAFARMAGQSFGDMMATGGAMGSQTFQSMGLSQGLGMQTGMGNYALARGGQMAGQFSPQMMGLVGGAGGLANMNNMFSASMLQMPMLGPSVMASHGGINQGSLNTLLGGGANAFAQTGMAANALSGMTGRQGVGGLGMAVAMQPLIQDTVGRTLQASGPFAQRNFEDQNILSTMRQMGMRGSGGFLTMAQTMGMPGTQAVARAQELGSPAYYDRQRDQIEVSRRDNRASELAARDAAAPGFFATLGQETGIDTGRIRRSFSRSFDHAVGLGHHSHYAPTTDEGSRRDRRVARSQQYRDYVEQLGARGERRGDRSNFFSEASDGLDVAAGEGFGGAGTYMAGLLGVGSLNTRGRLQNMREGSRLLGLTASTSNGEQDAASRRMAKEFGAGTASELQMDMARAIANRVNNNVFGSTTGQSVFNATARGAGMAATGGFGDMGNLFQSRQMTGTDIQQAFVSSAVRRSVSREQATAYFRDHASDVVQSATGDLQARLTPQQQQALFDQAERSAGRGTGRGGFGAQVRDSEERLRTRLFGQNSAQFQDAFSSQMENIEGVGRPGSAQNNASRRYIMTAAMLNQRLRQSNLSSDQRAQIERQLGQVREQARSEGVDTNASRVKSQITGAANRMGEGVASDMARAFTNTNADRSGRDLMRTVGEGETEGANLRLSRREADGFGALAAGSGALADALQHAGAGDVSKYNRSRVRSAIEGLGRQDMEGMPAEQRDLIRRIRAGGRDGETALSELGLGSGARGSSLRREYQNNRTFVGKWWDNLINAGSGEDAHVNRELRRTTNADRDADRQTAQTGAAQSAAESGGLGGAADTLNQAAASLQRAADSLQSVTQGGALDRMIGS